MNSAEQNHRLTTGSNNSAAKGPGCLDGVQWSHILSADGCTSSRSQRNLYVGNTVTSPQNRLDRIDSKLVDPIYVMSRHNPQPRRVRHFYGLHDSPICAVFDWYPRKNMMLTADSLALTLSKRPQTSRLQSNLPSKIRTQQPGITLAPWRLELQALTKALGLTPLDDQPSPAGNDGTRLMPTTGGSRPKSGTLSATDGVEPRPGQVRASSARRARSISSSRSGSRCSLASRGSITSRDGRRDGGNSKIFDVYSQFNDRLLTPSHRRPESSSSRLSTASSSMTGSRSGRKNDADDWSTGEGMVLQLLCQILNVDDVSTAQNWLLTASDNDKALVLELIRTALTSQSLQQQQPDDVTELQQLDKTDVNSQLMTPEPPSAASFAAVAVKSGEREWPVGKHEDGYTGYDRLTICMTPTEPTGKATHISQRILTTAKPEAIGREGPEGHVTENICDSRTTLADRCHSNRLMLRSQGTDDDWCLSQQQPRLRYSGSAHTRTQPEVNSSSTRQAPVPVA